MSLFSLSILLLAATVGSAQMTGDLRLVGGDYDYEGRVEVYYSGEWGTVCSNYFNLADATVICRQLRYSGATTFTRFPSVQMQGSGRIWLDNVDCYGTETALTDCHFNGWGSSSCSHYQDVVVTCSGLSDDRRDGTIRLVDGSSSKEGRVEVYYRGEWGTVCDDNFDDRAGRVVCRQLGYSADHVKVMERAYYGEGSGRIWLDNVHCYGSEASLSDCSSAGWGNENCGHYEDVSVQCGDVHIVGIALAIVFPSLFLIFVVAVVVVVVCRRQRARRAAAHVTYIGGALQAAGQVHVAVGVTPMGPSVMYPSTVYSPESHQSAIYRPAGHSPPPPPPPPPSSQQYSGDDKNADLPPPYSVATTSSDDSVATAGVYPPSKLYNLRLDDAPSQPDPRPSSSDY